MKENRSRWDEIYKKGAHWEKGSSKNMQLFIKYLNKGDRVLDAGCGSGQDSIFLAKQGFEVWGIDISNEAIKKAKKNKEKYKLENLHFLVGDIQNLKFEDEFFDAIYSGWVLHNLPLEKPASEIHRVLKKRGIAFLAFLLNTKYVKDKKIVRFHRKEDILKVYKKRFKILKQIQFHQEDFETERPHTHDVFIIILKKL